MIKCNSKQGTSTEGRRECGLPRNEGGGSKIATVVFKLNKITKEELNSNRSHKMHAEKAKEEKRRGMKRDRPKDDRMAFDVPFLTLFILKYFVLKRFVCAVFLAAMNVPVSLERMNSSFTFIFHHSLLVCTQSLVHTFVTHLLLGTVVGAVVLVFISWIIIIAGYHFRLLCA